MKETLFPHTIVVGLSSAGKSTSLRTLPIKTTALINTEGKALPFISKHKVMNLDTTSVNDYSDRFIAAYRKAIANDEIDTIAIDSFTSFKELLLRECQSLYKDWDVFTYYNKKIQDIFLELKQVKGKLVIWTGIPDVTEGPDGATTYSVKVDGKVWRNAIEKEFTTTLWADTSETEKGLEHRFITNKIAGYTNTPAKSPLGLLDPIMPNDLGEYREKVFEAYGFDKNGKPLKD